VRDDSDLADPFDDAALIADLQRLRGTSEEVLAAPELMAMVLPVLRADYLLCGNYRYRARARLACPIHVLGGADDDVARDALEAWACEGSEGGSFRLFAGGHFYLQTQQADVLAHVEACLAEVFDAAGETVRARGWQDNQRSKGDAWI
jgi:surfactin synthase thioesterase subunit